MIFWILFLAWAQAAKVQFGKISAGKLKGNDISFNGCKISLKDSNAKFIGMPPTSITVLRGRLSTSYLDPRHQIEVMPGDTLICKWKNAELKAEIEKRNELKAFMTSKPVKRRAAIIITFGIIICLIYLLLSYFDNLIRPETRYRLDVHELHIYMKPVMRGSDASLWLELQEPSLLGPGVIARVRLMKESIDEDYLRSVANTFFSNVFDRGLPKNDPNVEVSRQ